MTKVDDCEIDAKAKANFERRLGEARSIKEWIDLKEHVKAERRAVRSFWFWMLVTIAIVVAAWRLC